MRIAFYNQMFGLNGKGFWSNVLGHWAVHFSNNGDRVRERVNIDWTIDLVRESGADIIGLAEILEGQESEVKRKLTALDYDYIHFGRGHKTEFRDSYVEVAVASRTKCKKVNVNDFPTRNEMGGGGGLIHCHFPSLDLDIVNVHLASCRKKVCNDQLGFLSSYLRDLKRNLILMGDFNLPYGVVGNYFSELSLILDCVKTCSVTPVMNWFYNKDVDHILVRGFERNGDVGVLNGMSDHRLIYADLV